MNQRSIHNLVQGSPEWAAFRLEHDGASEAAAAMGISKKVTRSELLRIKHTGIAKEFSDWVQTNILDYGHEVEAKARPLIEQLIGEELYPITMSYGRLSASCDGLTMDSDTALEHKQWAEELAEAVRRKELPQEHQPQCQQVMHVTGAKRVIFTVSDGTPENLVWMEVLPDPEWVKRIEAAWKQFAEDLKTYTPPEVIPAAVATPQMQLPAVSVQVNGGVAVVDNLTVFGDALRAYVERINKEPATDQDFADLEATVKTLKAAEDALEAVKSSALGQVQSIDMMKRTADQLQELARANRLTIEKLVKAEKENRRNAIIRDGQMSVGAHIANLNARLGKPYMPIIVADFAGKAKGLKTLASLQNAVDTELARVKIEANEVADRIEINLNFLRENAKDYAFLFADTATIVLKQKEDFEALAKLRIAEHKEAEAKRIEAETARIRAEEEAKAAAKVKAEQEAAARITEQQQSSPQNIPESIPAPNDNERKWALYFLGYGDDMECEPCFMEDEWLYTKERAEEEANSANEKAMQHNIPRPGNTRIYEARLAPPGYGKDPIAAALTDTGATIKLGEIGELLGFTVTAEFLKLLGFTFTTEKNAKLFRLADFPRICAAIARHVDAVGTTSMRGQLV